MHLHHILPYNLPATSPKLTSNSSMDNSFSIPPMLLFHAKMQSFFFPQKVLWNLCVGGGKKNAQHGILSWQIRIVNSNCLWQICIMIRCKKRRSLPLVRVHFLSRSTLCFLSVLLSVLSPSFWLLFSSLPDCLFPSCWLPFFIFLGCLSLSSKIALPYPASSLYFILSGSLSFILQDYLAPSCWQPLFILQDYLTSRQVRFPSPFCFFRLYETGQPLKLQNRRATHLLIVIGHIDTGVWDMPILQHTRR